VFWVSSFSLSVTSLTQSGLIEPEVERQLSHYQRCGGCNIAVVDFAKGFPYEAGSYTQEDIRELNFVLHCYFYGLTYILCSTSSDHAVLRRCEEFTPRLVRTNRIIRLFYCFLHILMLIWHTK